MIDPIILVYFYVYLIGYIVTHIYSFQSIKHDVLNKIILPDEKHKVAAVIKGYEEQWLEIAHSFALCSWIGLVASVVTHTIYKSYK